MFGVNINPALANVKQPCNNCGSRVMFLVDSSVEDEEGNTCAEYSCEDCGEINLIPLSQTNE